MADSVPSPSIARIMRNIMLPEIVARDPRDPGLVERNDQALEKDLSELDVVFHCCNCMCTMGAGMALTLRRMFPQIYAVDKTTTRGDVNKLGAFSSALVRDGRLTIVNMYAQYRYGRDSVRYLNYDALKLCLARFFEYASKLLGDRVRFLRIGTYQMGCNLAGGDWKIVRDILDKAAKKHGCTITVYNPRRLQ